MKTAVSGLEQEFPGQIVATNVDAKLPESVAAIEALGFKNHGLVIRGAGGRVLWSQPDHEVNVDAARAKLAELTGASP